MRTARRMSEASADELGRVKRERDLYRALLELGSQERLEPLLEHALALVVSVTGATQGYLEVRLGALQPTRAGYNVREGIESATDEIYFHQWPNLGGPTVAWLHDALARLIAALPDAPTAR